MYNTLLQDSENTYLLELSNLQAKLQQLQRQVAQIEEENSDLEGLEATKEQLTEERYQLEMLLSQKDAQYLQV